MTGDDARVGTVGSLFAGVVALFVEAGVQPRRLKVMVELPVKIWKEKLQQRGGVLRQHINRSVTHVFAADVKYLAARVGHGQLKKLRAVALEYEWLEDCLKTGCIVPTEPHLLIRASTIECANSNELTHDAIISDDDLNKSCSLQGSNADEYSCKRRRVEDWMDVIQRGGKLGVLGTKGITTQTHDILSPSQISTSQETVGDKSTCLVPGEELLPMVMQESQTSYSPPNLNKNITAIFDELKNIYEALGDDRRSFSYSKANSVLEKFPRKINDMNEVKGLPAVGKSMQDQIAEIIKTGKSSRLEHFRDDEKVSTVSLLGAVWGIGPVLAQRLYEKGHRTLKDLESEETLTPPQRLGLKFHSDINKKIPRNEVQEMEIFVKKCAESIEPEISILCGGSYRRGKEFVGDMDFVVTHPDGLSHAGFLSKLVQKLKELDFLTEDLRLSLGHSFEERGVDTYFGLCKYPGREQRHRIDIKVYPIEKYPFGLVAWTGNDILNRRLRILAEAKGYRLDDHGLFPVTRDAEGQKVAQRSSGVPCKTEREVFEKLGFPWLEPHERNL